MTGLFKDRERVERAYQATLARGYRDKDIDVVMSDATRSKYFGKDDGKASELGTKAAEGAATTRMRRCRSRSCSRSAAPHWRW